MKTLPEADQGFGGGWPLWNMQGTAPFYDVLYLRRNKRRRMGAYVWL